MQRADVNIRYGQNLHAPSIATGWGVTNPGPSAFEAFGEATGEMMGQSDDLSDIAAHAPIVSRVTGTWVGDKHRVVPAGTVLCVMAKEERTGGRNKTSLYFSDIWNSPDMT